MSNKKLGTEPAFGYPAHTDINDGPGYGRSSNTHDEEKGISKRLYLAGMAMQGLLANSELAAWLNIECVAERALMQADELLRKEIE